MSIIRGVGVGDGIAVVANGSNVSIGLDCDCSLGKIMIRDSINTATQTNPIKKPFLTLSMVRRISLKVGC